MSSASLCLQKADCSDLINKKNILSSSEEFKNRKGEIIVTLENDQFSQVSDATTIRHVYFSVIIFIGKNKKEVKRLRRSVENLESFFHGL